MLSDLDLCRQQQQNMLTRYQTIPGFNDTEGASSNVEGKRENAENALNSVSLLPNVPI